MPRATGGVVGSTISNSGVMNYLNKFGEMTTLDQEERRPRQRALLRGDPLPEASGNIPEYTSLSGNATTKFNLADGFPVITSWDDPIQYWCRTTRFSASATSTHRDKNLPGNSVTTDEPTVPASVTADTTVNVVTATQKVAQLEGITIATPFTGRENSAYIAGLAYDSHTKDLRSDLQEKQTVSTHWVDVRENQILEPRARNQYLLAAKYGGFTSPTTTTRTHATASAAELVVDHDGRVARRATSAPTTSYVASEADKMVESLTRAFAKIAAESVGSA